MGACFIAGEYEKAGVSTEDVDTGAVIITGETLKKVNAREVASVLSTLAEDFVVATAGADLESALSGREPARPRFRKTRG